MYVRQVQGKTLTFQVSGKLWRDSLVMTDRETGSLWSQITGECFRGELKGSRLDPYPFEMVTWANWVAAYPQTRVLFKESESRGDATHYAGYFDDPERQGIFGRSVEDRRLDPKTVVVAVEMHGMSLVFPRDRLPGDRVVVAPMGESHVLVVPLSAGGFSAFHLDLSQGVPAPVLEAGRLKVPGPGKTAAWDPRTGLSLVSGIPDLAPLASHVVYWFGWVSFFPNSVIWEQE